MLKFIYDYCLNSMNSKQNLELISSGLQLQWNFPDQYFSVYCNLFFENTTSDGKDLMLVMVFSAQ